MKIKTAYIYGAVAILVALFLVLFTPSQSKKGDLPENPELGGMPNDEAHKGLTAPGSPSGSNVSPSVKEKLNELKTAADKTPIDTAAIKTYADFLSMAHQPLEAVDYYKKIIKINPKRTDVNFEIAYIYFTQREYDKAENTIEQILNYDKNNAEAKYNLGATAFAKGEKDRAAKIWSDLLKQNIDSNLKQMVEKSINSLN